MAAVLEKAEKEGFSDVPALVDNVDPDFEDDDSNDETSSAIQLGFAEKAYNGLFDDIDWRNWDGGKVGGLPVWLDYEHLPMIEDLACRKCSDPMSFLLQIYSPLDNVDSAFHRAIYIFCCRKQSCVQSADGFQCLRVQLPRKNALYPANPQDLSSTDFEPPTARILPQLCALCGCRAKNVCSRCRSVRYCSKSHQKLHWKTHKHHCSADAPPSVFTLTRSLQGGLDESQRNVLFPEYEIVIEPEDEEEAGKPTTTPAANSTSTEENAGKIIDSIPKNVKVWEDAVTSGGADEEMDAKLTQQDYNQALSEQKYDPVYINFLSRIARGGNQQILRYHTNSLHRHQQSPPASSSSSASPVTISLEDQERGRLLVSREMQRAATRVPPCAHCGAPRALEFQVMPQILHYLGVEKHTKVSITDEVASQTPASSEQSAETTPVKKTGIIENHKEDDLDWGTLDIYTCIASCHISPLEGDNTADASDSKSSTTLRPTSHYLSEFISLQPLPDLLQRPEDKAQSAAALRAAVESLKMEESTPSSSDTAAVEK